MAKLVSLREFARQQGVSLKAVQKAINSGRIRLETRGGKKGLDPEVAALEWEESTDPAKQRKEDASPSQSSAASRVYADSRAAKESYAARMAELDYKEKAGSLASVDKVKLGAFQTARIVRDGLQGMSARISGKLAAESDPVKVQIILDEEINRALMELVREGREKTGVTDAG